MARLVWVNYSRDHSVFACEISTGGRPTRLCFTPWGQWESQGEQLGSFQRTVVVLNHPPQVKLQLVETMHIPIKAFGRKLSINSLHDAWHFTGTACAVPVFKAHALEVWRASADCLWACYEKAYFIVTANKKQCYSNITTNSVVYNLSYYSKVSFSILSQSCLSDSLFDNR